MQRLLRYARWDADAVRDDDKHARSWTVAASERHAPLPRHHGSVAACSGRRHRQRGRGR
jgi:hypothetical protein